MNNVGNVVEFSTDAYTQIIAYKNGEALMWIGKTERVQEVLEDLKSWGYRIKTIN